MNNWVEFKTTARRNFIVRPEHIDSVIDNDGHTTIRYSSGNKNFIIDIDEPYKQVKQKIMDAESQAKADTPVEYFTKEEYGTLYRVIDLAELHIIGTNEYIPARHIKDKLSKILGEEE